MITTMTHFKSYLATLWLEV